MHKNNNQIMPCSKQLTGPIPYNMTNDYMFKAVLQECPEARTGLVSALLMIEPELIDVQVTNPIILGKSIASKDFYLDVRVTVNNKKVLNLEMQVRNEGNWTDRTLSYSSRSFDGLQKGQDYSEIIQLHQISFTCFDVFRENNKFYDTFQLTNQDHTQIYSDNFKLSVVNLKRIDEATAQDKSFKLDAWCKLITAKSWEDLQNIAKEDPFMVATVEKIQSLFNNFDIQEEARRREEYYRRLHQCEETIEAQRAEIAEKDSLLSEKDSLLSEKDSLLSEKDSLLSEKDSNYASLLAEFEEYKRTHK